MKYPLIGFKEWSASCFTIVPGASGLNVFYQNRNILMTYRINRRRIHHFRTKVTQLHSLHITQLRNGISRADDTRVSCHKAIHIRPNFQNIRIQSCRNNRRCIIRSTSSPSWLLLPYSYPVEINPGTRETFGISLKVSMHQPVRQLWIKNMLIMFLFSLNESTRIEPHCPSISVATMMEERRSHSSQS